LPVLNQLRIFAIRLFMLRKLLLRDQRCSGSRRAPYAPGTAITFRASETAHKIPKSDAATLASGLRARAADPASIEALDRVLKTIVYEIGPAMKLYDAIDLARHAA
jgi:hypothetical protein